MQNPFSLLAQNIRSYLTPQQKKSLVTSQVRETWQSPFQVALNGYIPMKYNMDLYDFIREAIPVLDIAVLKLVKLIGDYRIETNGNDAVKDAIEYFMKEVKVGHFHKGFHSAMWQMCDSAFSKGMGFVEVVPTRSLNGVDRLAIPKANTMRFVKKDDGNLTFGQMQDNHVVPVNLDSRYVQYLGFDFRDGHPQGLSMFYSLPFIAQLFVRMTNAIDNGLWRIGDPTFLGIVEGGPNSKYADVKEALNGLGSNLKTAFQKRKAGQVEDVLGGAPAGGSVRVEVLGKDGVIFDMQWPHDIIMENIVTRTGLPDFMFSLKNWSNRQEMSKLQSDMLISDITTYRTYLTPIIEEIIGTFLILEGYTNAKFSIEWEPVNLLDLVEEAKARHLNAAAEAKELESRLNAWMTGFVADEDVVEWAIVTGMANEKTIKNMGREKFLERMSDRAKMIKAAKLAQVFNNVN